MLMIAASSLTAESASPGIDKTWGSWQYSVSGGEASVTGYMGNERTEILPSRINGYPLKAVLGIHPNDSGRTPPMTSLLIENGVQTLNISAFAGCLNLKKVIIPSSVLNINMGDSFKYGHRPDLVIDPENPNYTSLNGILYLKKTDNTLSKLISYPSLKIGKFETPVGLVEIGKGAFANCLGLKAVAFGNNITNIETGAFYGCRNLEEVEVPKRIRSIKKEVFADCENLTSLTIPEGVEEIGERAFANCKSLTNLVIGAKVKTIETKAFSGCESLTNVVIPESVSSLGAVIFEGCPKLTNIVVHGPFKTNRISDFTGK